MTAQAPLLTGSERITIDPHGRVVIPTRLLSPETLHHLTNALPGATVTDDADPTIVIDGSASVFTYPTLGQHLLDLPHVVEVMPPKLLDRLHTAVARYAAHINASTATQLPPERDAYWRSRLPGHAAALVRPYQLAAIDFVHNRCGGRAFLGDDPGGGKTLMSLLSLAVTEPTSLPAVVVCKATLKSNWVREVGMWLGEELDAVILEGRTNLGNQLPHADFYIVNYELLHHRLDDLLQVRPRALVVDESQMLKTAAYPDDWVARYKEWEPKQEALIAEWREECARLKAEAAAGTPDGKPPKNLKLPKRPKAKGRPKTPPNGGAWRTWAAKQIAHHPTMQTVLLLSATPAPNGRNLEWLPQIDLLDRLDDLGGEAAFVARYARDCRKCVDEVTGRIARECVHRTYATKPWGSRNDDGAINSAELATRLRALMMVRRSQRQMFPQLPPIQQIPVELPITGTGIHPETGEKVNWRTEYVKAEKEFVAWLKEHAAGKARNEGGSVGRAVARAIAASEGDYARLVQLAHLRKTAAYGKLDAVVDWIGNWVSESPDGDDEPRQAVVFAWHKNVQQALIDALGGWLDSPAGKARKQRLEAAYGGTYPGVPRILAATEMTGEEIESNKGRFNTNPDEPFIVCSIAAAAEGHSMSRAQLVVAVELPSSGAGTLRQMVGRSYGRADNPSGCTLALLTAVDPKGDIETIEERLLKAMMVKQENMANVLDDGRMLEIERAESGGAITDVMGDLFASYLD